MDGLEKDLAAKIEEISQRYIGQYNVNEILLHMMQYEIMQAFQPEMIFVHVIQDPIEKEHIHIYGSRDKQEADEWARQWIEKCYFFGTKAVCTLSERECRPIKDNDRSFDGDPNAGSN